MSWNVQAQELMTFAKEQGVYPALDQFFPNWQSFWKKEWIDSFIEKEDPEWVVLRVKSVMESFEFENAEKFMEFYQQNLKLDEYRRYLKTHPNFHFVLQTSDKISEINAQIARLNSQRISLLSQIRDMMDVSPNS